MTADLEDVGLYTRVYGATSVETLRRLSVSRNGKKPWLTKEHVETGLRFGVVAAKAKAKDPEALELLFKMRHFMGLTLFDVLFDTFVYDMPVEKMEKAHSWPHRSAKILLRSALELVAQHNLLGEG